MGGRSKGWWVGFGALLMGCTPTPPEVVDVYDGKGGSGSGSGGAGSSDGLSATSGPVATGSAGSGSGPGVDGSTSGPVDPSSTTDDPPAGSTGPGSTGEAAESSSGDPIPLTCDEIFSGATGYHLCEFDDESCSFSVTTGGQSCTTICGTYGQTCLGALDNPAPPAYCTVEGSYDCGGTSKGTTICICSR